MSSVPPPSSTRPPSQMAPSASSRTHAPVSQPITVPAARGFARTSVPPRTWMAMSFSSSPAIRSVPAPQSETGLTPVHVPVSSRSAPAPSSMPPPSAVRGFASVRAASASRAKRPPCRWMRAAPSAPSARKTPSATSSVAASESCAPSRKRTMPVPDWRTVPWPLTAPLNVVVPAPSNSSVPPWRTTLFA